MMPVIGMLGIFKRSSTVTRRPFLRDSLFYWLTLVVLSVMLFNKRIYLIESVILLAVFVLYLVVVVLWRYVSLRAKRRIARVNRSAVGINGSTHSISDFPEIETDSEREEGETSSFLDEIEFASTYRSISGARVNPAQGSYYHGALAFSETPTPTVITFQTFWFKFLDLIGWYQLQAWQKPIFIVVAPSLFVRHCSIPPLHLEQKCARFFVTACALTTPLLLLLCTRQFLYAINIHDKVTLPVWVIVLAGGVLLMPLTYFICNPSRDLRFYGQIAGSVALFLSGVWLYVVACEFVGCTKVIGQICNISDSILGLTVVAWGTSSIDLVADVMVAQKGLLDMATGAAFSSATITLCLSVGIGCTVYSARRRDSGSSSRSMYTPVCLDSDVILSLLWLHVVTLATMACVPCTRWTVQKWYSVLLLIAYGLFTILSVLVAAEVIPLPSLC
eukprot:TRINITY_DN873_c0_g1_i10.p1 TRINITY_DN873_c0_g1~~TRINITY_DN873_c0_g1_i10.p1  ORF type:complete len:446 (-),score=56.36 TRINITY_DN873_c0_g1_i10:78-1415(-)